MAAEKQLLQGLPLDGPNLEEIWKAPEAAGATAQQYGLLGWKPWALGSLYLLQQHNLCRQNACSMAPTLPLPPFAQPFSFV